MKRRALLAAAGTAAVGLSAGCLDGSTGDDSTEWTHEPGGRVDTVSRDTVYVHETFRDGDGNVVALDAADGERRWSYGSSHGYSTYTDLTVADAVYFGLGDDAVGSGAGELYALERDGSERWTADTGSVYERPRLADGTVFAGSDDGVVRAFDVSDGAVEWRHELEPTEAGGPPDPTVAAVDEAVYVAAGRLHALDPATGEERWRYGDEDASIRDAEVHDGVAYFREGHSVRAVADGEERWRTEPGFESYPRVRLDDGRVFVRAGTALIRVDAGDGTRRWTADVDELAAWTVHGDRVYATGTSLSAFDAGDGTERWTEPMAEGLLGRLEVAPDGDDHAVFVEEEDAAVHRVTPDGEVTWSASVPGDVWSLVVEDLVYVGTSEAVHALAPS